MRFLIRLFLLGLLLLLAAAGGIWWWSTQPFAQPDEGFEFRIPPGSGLNATVRRIGEAGVPVHPQLFVLLARINGAVGTIRAGSYQTEPGETPGSLLDKLVQGRVAQIAVTLVEGRTFRQFRAQLDAQPALLHDTRGLSEGEIARRLGLPWQRLEGRLMPDTYRVDKQSSDLELIGRAVDAMRRQVDAVWQQRQPGLPYRTPDELLIMASIVEKETGQAADRPLVAAVFVNRLRIGMRLQTDPTVIYGLGENFDGNLRRSHLQTDHEFNTYTRAGLPPTPIAMPGLASLQAAAAPAASDALYFVARGDGSSHFSRTLDEHNRAVDKFQRGKP